MTDEKVEKVKSNQSKTFKLKRYRTFGLLLSIGLIVYSSGTGYHGGMAWGILLGTMLSHFDAFQ